MKKLLVILVLSSTYLFSQEYAVVNTWAANLRTTPTSNINNIKKSVKFGKILPISQKGGLWVKLKNKHYIYAKSVDIISNLNSFKIKVITSKGNIRTRPAVKKKYLVKNVYRGDILNALYLSKKGWYVLEDETLIYANSVIEVKDFEKAQKSLKTRNRIQTKQIKLNYKKTSYTKEGFEKEIQKSITKLIVSSLTLGEKVNAMESKLNAKTNKTNKSILSDKEIKTLAENLRILKKNEHNKKLYIATHNTPIWKDKSLTNDMIATISKDRIIEVINDDGSKVQLLVGGYASKKYLERLSVKLNYLDQVENKINELTTQNEFIIKQLNTKLNKQQVEKIVSNKLNDFEKKINSGALSNANTKEIKLLKDELKDLKSYLRSIFKNSKELK